MSFEKKLKKYAELIVRAGLNVQKNQIVVIDAPVESVELVRLITKEAYQTGAKEVIVKYHDEVVSRYKYEYVSKDEFSKVPKWFSEFRNSYAEQNAAFLTIHSDDPEGFKGIDPAKVAMWSKSVSTACKPFYDSLDLGINTWCIVASSSVKWANKVYPDMSDSEAVEALWNAIFKAVKVDDDFLVSWDEHRKSFEARVEYLNNLNLKEMVYTNSLGTNLTVTLNEGYLFAGGGSYTTNGVYFFANIPTEEIFTCPFYKGTNGIVYSSLPLNYNGNIIDEFKLVFENGKIVDYDAKTGKEILREIINIDEGSHYLGEIALVPYDSPISNMKTLFYNTLFDENASCHLALGKGFSECLKNGLSMTKEQLLEKGINDSLTHVDFMIGTSDLMIKGITKDNQEVMIFKNGNFAF
ncbi:aminopeptidase [Thomasclavelia cocleata]|uniref:aminopeptidase n=1 Tax=Thomasclavelia cocleata TaxID=69824 RepID=UPI002493EB6F|nr:aminopeptidase [Thomasclavelia cocleata]